MGWLSTAIDIATFAAVTNNAMKTSRLEDLRKQAEQIGAIQGICRDYIFRANQAKEDMLEYRGTKPLALAAGLAYLEGEIQESGITTEIFSDISDKEYLASTLRTIRQNRRELMELLDADQQKLVETASQSLRNFESLSFVVSSFDDAMRLQSLMEQQKENERRKPVPRFLGGGREEREWQLRRDQLQTEISQLGGPDAYARWATQWLAFGHKSKEELAKLLNNMEIVLQSVFQDRHFIPKLSLLPTAGPGAESTRSEAKMTWGGVTGRTLTSPVNAVAPAESDDGRVACPNCGYRNSKHRTTCKNCRNHLPD